ncbi:MAG: glnA 1 [Aeromicrobium sp.]|nr:glnA 1 [Aeromicrobium sp.]
MSAVARRDVCPTSREGNSQILDPLIADSVADRRAAQRAAADHGDDALAEATYAQASLLPAMAAVRSAADALEAIVADDLWPLPTYQEMLYIL